MLILIHLQRMPLFLAMILGPYCQHRNQFMILVSIGTLDYTDFFNCITLLLNLGSEIPFITYSWNAINKI